MASCGSKNLSRLKYQMLRLCHMVYDSQTAFSKAVTDIDDVAAMLLA